MIEFTWTDGMSDRVIERSKCKAWVFNTGPDGIDQEGHQCLHAPSPGSHLCHLHQGLWERSRSPGSLEQFAHFDQALIEVIDNLANGSQIRLFSPGHFRKKKKIRSWLSEIEILIEETSQISLVDLTDRFNSLYNTNFTTRQMAQGVKVVIDRGLVMRKRVNVNSEKIVFYEWI